MDMLRQERLRVATAAIAVTVAALFTAAPAARGQTTPNLLAQPRGTLVCRVIASPPLRILELFDQPDSTGPQRQTKVAVDSAGAPVFIQVWVRQPRDSTQRARGHILLAALVAGGKAFRAEGDADSMLVERDSTRYPKLLALSDSEIAVARALAASLWERRCMKEGR